MKKYILKIFLVFSLWSLVFGLSSVHALSLNSAYKDYLYRDYQAAIEKAKRLKRDDRVLYFLGLAYIKIGDYPEARFYLDKLIKSFSHSKLYEQGLVKLADSYFLEGNFRRAKDIYKEIETKYPRSNFLPTVYLRLAQIAAKEGRWQDKKKYLGKLKSKFPRSCEIKFADILERYGDYFTIQVGAFSKTVNALSLKKELERKYPTYIVKDSRGNLSLYKVRIGKFKDRKETQKIYLQLINQGYPARVYP